MKNEDLSEANKRHSMPRPTTPKNQRIELSSQVCLDRSKSIFSKGLNKKPKETFESFASNPNIQSKTEEEREANHKKNLTSNVDLGEVEKVAETKPLKVIQENQENGSVRNTHSSNSKKDEVEKMNGFPVYGKISDGLQQNNSNGVATPYSLVSDKSYGQLYKVISESEKKKVNFPKLEKMPVTKFVDSELEIMQTSRYIFQKPNDSKREIFLRNDEELGRIYESTLSSQKESQEKTMQYIIEARKQRDIIKK